jgi:hypothetical protein
MRPLWLPDRRALKAQVAMLEALARSQTAVARMLECAADAAEEAKLPAALIRQELRALAEAQSAMIAVVAGIAPRRPKRGGPPAPPWLHPLAGRGTDR